MLHYVWMEGIKRGLISARAEKNRRRGDADGSFHKESFVFLARVAEPLRTEDN